MNDAFSEARKTAARAMSAGSPTRPSGTVFRSAAFLSAVPVKRLSMPVSIGPGATALMRTPTRCFQRRRLCHAFDGVLAPDIDRGARSTFVPVGRGYVDDAAATLRLHHAQLVLHAEQRAKHIGVEGGCVGLGRLLGHRAGLAFGAGRVDGRVQAAKPRHGPIDQTADFVVMTNVGLDEGGLGAEAAKFGFEGFAFRVPAAGDDDAGALLGEGDGGGAPDAGQGPGNQDNRRAHWSLLVLRSARHWAWLAEFEI